LSLLLDLKHAYQYTQYLAMMTSMGSPSPDEATIQKWSLYEEAHAALMFAFLMFCVPDLRAVARDGLLNGDAEQIQRIIDLPCSLEDISTIFSQNKDLLTEERLKSEERAALYDGALSLAIVKCFEIDESGREMARQMTQLICLDDENEEEHCVYAVVINHWRRRICVSFRGSVTNKDFRQDLKAVMTTIDNPVHFLDNSQPTELGVHLGFREYLYKEESLPKILLRPRIRKDQPEKQDEFQQGTRKFEIILTQVKDLIEQNPNYTLLIVGHSLGGALATMLALEAAADINIPSPVTCITSGAPKVGNLAFSRAFEWLERNNRLRCLQVANDRDPVTLMPPTGAFNPCHALACQGRRFRHVGLRLKQRHEGYVIYFPAKMSTYFGTLMCDCMQVGRTCLFIFVALPILLIFMNAFLLVCIPTTIFCVVYALKVSRKHHTQLMYIHRLDGDKETLSQLFLDDLNARRWERPRWRVPVLLSHHGNNICCRCRKKKSEGSRNYAEDQV
jgi:pimeloyl-ACP methyl ester carboxylesterase